MDIGLIQQLVNQQQTYMVEMRRKFHENPELSGEEVKTREILIKEIENMGLSYRLIRGTGIIAFLEDAKQGPHRVLRADMDGLPVVESNENLKQRKACVSCIEGKSHACGHDAHMAMLLGAMKVLKSIQQDIEGTLYFCFEEGEETNCGVHAMLEALDDYPIEECFALHVYNELQAGKINLVSGARMAGNIGIGFHMKGKAGHGSRPDQAISPIIPAAHAITQINSAFVNQISAEETVTLGFGVVQAGEAPNVIPNDAYVGGTARFFQKEAGEKAFSLITEIAKHTAMCHGCDIEFEARHRISLDPVVNDTNVVKCTQEKLKELCGDEVFEACSHWYASECYSLYLKRYRGALALLGIKNEQLGSGAPHHSSEFDLDESVLSLGACAHIAFALSK